MIWLVLGSIVPGLLISLAVGYLIRRYASRWGLLDRPSQRKDHNLAVATSGGLAIWAGMMAAFLGLQIAVSSIDRMQRSFGMSPDSVEAIPPDLYPPLQGTAWGQFVQPHIQGLLRQLPHLWLLLAAATVMMILGLADDRFGLDWRLRMGIQTVVAGFMVWQGWRLSLFIEVPVVTGALSVLWIVGLVNTFNMLDNMDGLSAGVAAIAATLLAAVILSAPDPITKGPQLFVGGFLLVLVGALLGFLWHNCPPARLFMGDAGSYLIGFCLGTITISATFAGEGLPPHAILAPLCVLAVPLYDTVTVVWIRWREGRSPFHADRNHISHRLVDLGLSKRQAVLTIYAATAVCGMGAFFLHRTSTRGAVLILLLVAAVLFAIATVELTARKRRTSAVAGSDSTRR
ncbi:MAG: undecaprenyl/decaprenyl-phosphate alpha-N-acetylglucosaminyl 1-phosphate transferase [Planctomycetales bacterium]|nr:undecaprenyl/decaprenyl-phosphate alpha-N-acetylglucosaminyl 1-phosphate transferase [Planctomycetales bacterium]NIM08595.1 undecaprenyl/decaprenyl-phosphate alpha-N-acetylglucosaminyl 1-phosphate transferase [Planctomycetales bacterium]NIN08063.1 undecaprenyl/decaprenyl-phosphate alpha-N-acetylglucosaminyl 1-phosphate transferase [Planctomycetales bacterium]NIN77197.1 undecaprenyl/decaprenyl-phosphate alpha-N-acetylglucosaminyl 1-phosphate transferase [Planctomycetales bacterium]NIO34379.1 